MSTSGLCFGWWKSRKFISSWFGSTCGNDWEWRREVKWMLFSQKTTSEYIELKMLILHGAPFFRSLSTILHRKKHTNVLNFIWLHIVSKLQTHNSNWLSSCDSILTRRSHDTTLTRLEKNLHDFDSTSMIPFHHWTSTNANDSLWTRTRNSEWGNQLLICIHEERLLESDLVDATGSEETFDWFLCPITVITSLSLYQRLAESLIQTPTPLLLQNFLIRARIRVLQFFKFENPTRVQTPAAIINPTLILPCFFIINDDTDFCYCQKWNLTPDPGPVFPKFFIPTPGPNEKRRIQPE